MEIACNIPTEAAELWIIAVTIKPVSTPKIGFLKLTRSPENDGESANGATELLISIIPYINIANPTKLFPTSFFTGFLESIISPIPTKASNGENDSGFSIFTNTLSLDIPTRLISQAVMVVPIFDPMITATVLPIFISPELTSPTSITVTADELWIATVIIQPIRSPLKRFFVILFIIRSILLPAMRSRLCDI